MEALALPPRDSGAPTRNARDDAASCRHLRRGAYAHATIKGGRFGFMLKPGLTTRTGTLISVTVLRGDPRWGSGRSDMIVVLPLVLTVIAGLLAWLTRPYRVNLEDGSRHGRRSAGLKDPS